MTNSDKKFLHANSHHVRSVVMLSGVANNPATLQNELAVSFHIPTEGIEDCVFADIKVGGEE
ncbi:hypothetical protein BOTNAR_0295g00070 [Botryotinia narcissicola]|uniref:Uncharacterized protein n=1 Tax=Botryotinia narcissicola TaxID=278944 RepID=A0A4Z1I3Y7_9HELO|nr:hypothetical protein BOTNAR_0295g00070 [Botryotinia narcissicola]